MISHVASEVAFRCRKAFWDASELARMTYVLPAHLQAQPLFFEPDFGRRRDDKYFGANCYAYSLGLSEGFQRWATPGELKKVRRGVLDADEFTERAIQRRLEADDLIRIQPHSVDPARKQVLAVVIAGEGLVEDRDYHFMRLHADQTGWSSKSGGGYPTVMDDAGNVIECAERSDWGNYKVFGGYYTVPDSGIKYRYSPYDPG